MAFRSDGAVSFDGIASSPKNPVVPRMRYQKPAARVESFLQSELSRNRPPVGEDGSRARRTSDIIARHAVRVTEKMYVSMTARAGAVTSPGADAGRRI